MTSRSLGAANPGPRVGPLVISEIMYHPLSADNDLEYLEILNPTASAVDLTNWQLAGGVDFAFDPGTIIPAGDTRIIISFNPAKPENAARVTAFRVAYGLDGSVPLLGGWSGTLNNAGETLRLYRPDEPPAEEPSFIPILLEDEVIYEPLAPWPIAADGTGPALLRKHHSLWGNDPASWSAVDPNPAAHLVAVDDSFTALEDSSANPLDVLANDRGTATLSGFTATDQGGTVSVDGSVLRYTPAAGFTGTDRFSYTISQPSGAYDSAEVTVIVTPVDDPPVANSANFTTIEDTSFTGQLTASDIDGGPLSFSKVTQAAGVWPGSPGHTLILFSDGSFTYTPLANFAGTDSFTFSVNGGSTAVATILVTPVDDPPVANSASYSTAEDTPLLGQLIANDVDGGPVTFTGQPFIAADGSFTYAPAANFHGTDSFVFHVGSSSAVATIVVSAVDDPPLANAASFTTIEDTPLIGQLTVSDIDGGPAIFSGAPFIAADGSFTYAPAANFHGTDSFLFHAGSSSAVATIVVTPVNDPPVALPDSLTVAEDSTDNTLDLLANDSDPDDGDALSIVSSPLPYTPPPNFHGTVTFTYSITDGQATVTSQLSILVTPVNDPPVALPDSLTVDEDSSDNTLDLLANDSDIDGDELSIVSSPLPYSPPANFHGSVSFTYSISDGQAMVTSQLTILVRSINDPPIARPDSFTVAEDNVDNNFDLLANDSDADGDALSILTSPLPYTPPPNFHGSNSFSYTISDGEETSTGVVTIIVTPIDDPPVANSASFTTAEDTPFTALVTASDVDGDPITFTGPAFLSADGSFTYTPAPDFHGVDSFVFHAGSSSAVVTIVVTPANDLPVANSASFTTSEDSELNANVTASDIDGDVLSYIRVANVGHGSLSLASSGAFTYLPAANFAGSDSFSFKANDGSADTPVVAVTLVVNSVNDPPSPDPDSYLLSEDLTLIKAAPGVLENDSDVDGDPLTVSLIRAPARGTLTLHSDGAFTYEPPPNVIGNQDFVYAASDGILDSTSTVSLVIVPENDPPTAHDDSLTVSEDSTDNSYDLLANDVDIDGDSLSIVSSPLPYSPPADFHGTATLSYSITDGQEQASADIHVTVTPVNDPPVALADSLTVAEDSIDNSIDLLSNDSDIDGDELSIVSTPLPYTPPANFHGTVVLPYSISDGSVTVTSQLTIVVTPGNDLPVALPDSLTVAEDSVDNSMNLLANDSDIDGDTLSVVSGPLPYSPPADFHGTSVLPYTISDGTATVTGQVTIVVTPVNDPPTAVADSLTVAEDSVNNTLDLLANDSDVDGDEISIVSSPLPYSPPANFHGSVTLNYRISDGQATVTSQVTIVVTAQNDPPVALADSMTVSEDSVDNTLDLLANDSDIDGDELSIVSSPLPYSPPANFHGTVMLPYTISDGGITVTSEVTIVVTPLNDPPTARVDSFTVDEDSLNNSYDLLANDSDIDGDAISIARSPLPYSPPADFHGAVTLDYTITDGQVTVTSQVTIVVAPVNDPPVALPDSLTVDEDSVGNTLDLLANDTDIDGDTLSIVSSPLPYSPPADFHGTTPLSYSISDGHVTVTSQLTIVVTCVNDRPVALPDAFSGDEDQPLFGDTRQNDSDVDGDPLRATLRAPPGHGSVELATDGSFTYNPAPHYHGGDSFSYTLSDGILEAIANVSLSIANTNDTPIANAASFSTLEETPLIAQLSGSDIDGDLLTFSRVSGPVTLASNGSFTYIPQANFHGAASFSFQVTDGLANSAIAQVDLDVLPVNDPPVLRPDSFTIAEDSLNQSIDLLANDTDPDGDTLSIVSSPLPYTPPANFHGTTTLDYSVTDGSATVSSQVTIVVSSVNDPPIALPDSLTVAEDSSNNTLDLLANDSDLDGDELSIVNSPLPYSPPADFYGSVTLGYSITDGTVTVSSQLNIHVTPANDPPTAHPDSFTILEDSTNQTFDLLTNDLDVDGDAISIVSTPLPYTPPPNFHGPVTLGYSITDGQATVSSQVTIVVSSVNDPPVATAASFTGAEDAPLLGQLSGRDIENHPLRFFGPVFLGSDGSFTYLPPEDFHGDTSFLFHINDGAANSSPATVQLSITAVNDAPVALTDAFAGKEDQPLFGNVLQNDRDIDGDSLLASLVSGVTHGSLELVSDGSFTYNPNSDFSGGDGFSYRVSDGSLSVSSTVTFSIDNDNDAPVASAASFTTLEDQPLTGQLGGSDSDDDPLSFTLVSGPVSLASNGSFTYNPSPDFHGSASFNFQVHDGLANSAIAQVDLSVLPVNDLPVAVADSFTILEDSLNQSIDLLANDSDLDGDTVSIVSSPLPYSPPLNFHGTVPLRYTISDGQATVTGQLTIVVSPKNDAPVALPDSLTVAEDSSNNTLNLLANDSDIDGDSLSIVSSPLPYSPPPNFHGSVTLGYTISDGTTTASSQLTILVTPVNDPPVALPDSLTVTEDSTDISFDLLANDTDVDGDDLNIVSSPLPYTPPPNFHGSVSLGYSVTDGQATVSSQVTIVITPVNDAPVALPDSLTVAEDSMDNTLDLLANDIDIDGDTLSIVASPLPYSPPADFHGSVILEYSISDGRASATSQLSIYVTPANDAPVPLPDAFAGDENLRILGNVLLNDSDIDGDSLQASLGVGPAHGSLDLASDGSFSYQPIPHFSGSDSFTYAVSDGQVANSATVSLSISNTNDIPLADPASFSTLEDISFSGQLSGSDIDSDPLSFSLVSGSVQLASDGGFTYEPPADFHGTASFSFQVNDGFANSAIASVELVVLPVNDPPVALPDTFSIAEDSVNQSINLLANDSDVDGDALSILSSPLPYTPPPNFHGSVTLGYTVSDGQATVSSQVTIIVTPVNDLPVALPDSLTVTEDSANHRFDLLANDSDLDGDGLIIVSSPLPYSPPVNFNGTTTLPYTVSDGTATVTGELTIVVTPINDPPFAAPDSFTIGEDSVNQSIDLLANDSDVDGDTLSILSSPLPYTPPADFHGSVSFSYVIGDGTVTSTSQVTIVVNPVNDAPIAMPDSITVTEDSVDNTHDLLANDSDVDGGLLSIVSSPLPYSPLADFHGTTTLPYTISDGSTSVTGQLSIVVTPVNDPPVALPDSFTIAEDSIDQGFDLLGNDSDIDGDALSIVSSPLPYSPPADFHGTVTLGYTISDGQATASSEVTIVITPENDPPVAQPDSLTIAEDSANNTLDLLANDSDNDGDTLSIVSSPLPYTPPVDFHGTVIFDYSISDGQATTTGQLTIVVTPVNDRPIARPDSYVIAEDSQGHSFDLLANDSDIDGDPLVILASPLPYTPPANFHGSVSISYRISDGQASASSQFTVRVTPVNDAPVAVADEVTVDEDAVLEDTVFANDFDVDGDTLTASLIRNVTHGELTFGSDGTYSYAPDPDFFGSDSFSYKISDRLAESASAEVAIEVRPVNDAPVGFDSDYGTPEDTPLDVTAANGLMANDYDIDSPFIGLLKVDEPQHGDLELFADGRFRYAPDANFAGSDRFTYRVFDGLLFSELVVVSIRVSSVNDAPITEPDAYQVDEDGELVGASVLANDSDVEGDSLSASLRTPPAHGKLEFAPDGSFSYAPFANFAGSDGFSYFANDGKANSAAAQVSIVIAAENDLPVIQPFSLITNEDTPISFDAQTSDADGDVVTVDRNSYTPAADFHGVDSFAIIADDGQATSSFTVQVTVLPVNDTPVITPFSLTTNEDTPIDFVAQTSDIDGDSVTVNRDRYAPPADFHGVDSFVIIADDGQATSSFTVQVTVLPLNDPPVISPFSLTTDEDTPINFSAQTSDVDGDFIAVDRNSYTPPANFHGSDSFVIIADDGQATSSFTVQVTVVPVNDPPVIIPFSLTTDEDTPIDFVAQTSDIDGDPVSIDRNRYEPPANFHGSDSFAIIADDGQTTSSFTVQVIVLPVNDPPVITPFSLTTDEDTPVDFAAQTSDIDGDIVTVTHTRYTPPADFHGSDSFAISASDGTTTSSLTVTVLVNPVNDPPINTRSPAIDGLTIPGNTLTVDPGLWADIDGDNISFSYVWRRDGTTIATSATYHVTDSDPSHVFSVEVTADDGQVTVTNSTAPIAIGWQVTVGNLVFGMGDGPESSDPRISIIAPWRPVADSATWLLHSDSDVDLALSVATTPLPTDRFLSCYEVVAPDDLTPTGASATRNLDNSVLRISAGERWFAIRFDAVLTEVLVFRHGWNLCSFPIQPLAAPAFGPLWCEFGGEMQRAAIPDAMRGYWVWRARSGTALVHGIPAPSVITVAPGPNTIGVDRRITPAWNLNGPISVWRHDHFRETNILQPRRGYLIYSDQHQTLSW